MQRKVKAVAIAGKVTRQPLGHGQAVGRVLVGDELGFCAGLFLGQDGILQLEVLSIRLGLALIGDADLQQVERRGGQTADAVGLLGQTVVVDAGLCELVHIEINGHIALGAGFSLGIGGKFRRGRGTGKLIRRAEHFVRGVGLGQVAILACGHVESDRALDAARAGGFVQVDGLFKDDAAAADCDAAGGSFGIGCIGRRGQRPGQHSSGESGRKFDGVHGKYLVFM